jgi:uncharacterized membrane protein
MTERFMKIIGWTLVALGFLWTVHTAWNHTDSYDKVISERHQAIRQEKEAFSRGDMDVALNDVHSAVQWHADAEWIMTPAWLLLAGAICLSGCLKKENLPTLRRIALTAMWVIVGLIPVVVVLSVWSSRFHGILPVMPWQRSAIRKVLRDTRRIEIHRYGDCKATLVITNAAEIQRFGEALTPRRQSFYCLCRGMTDTWLIDGEGRTNIANITDEDIKFGGPWGGRVVFRMYQAVPPKPLLDLMAKYEHALDASAQPSGGANSHQPAAGARNSP